MRWLGALLIIVASTISVQAEDWTTADGKTYKNVVVIGQEGDGVRVTYEGGVGKLPYYELDDDTLRKLGQDPAALAIKRAAFVKAQAEAALQAKQDAAIAAEQKRKEAEAAALNAAQNGTTPAAQNATPGQTPAPGQTPVPGQNPMPGQNPVAPNSTATTQNPPTPSQPQNQNGGQAPGTAQNPAQNPAPAPGQQPAQNQASNPGGSPQPNFVPPANPRPTPAPPAADTGSSSSSAPDEEQAQYPNSKFQYDDNADISYLESNVVELQPMSPDASPAPAGPGTTLHFRITTEGHRAESPDEVEGFFYSSAALKKLATDRKVKFLVDGAFIPAQPQVEAPDADPDPLRTNQVSFFLSPEQTRAILSGKKVNVSVGGYDYRIDDPAMASLHGFMADITKLPPASTNYMKAFHHFVNRLPSIISVISSTCEYIILGAFGIVVVASIAAFVMGLTRFIKM